MLKQRNPISWHQKSDGNQVILSIDEIQQGISANWFESSFWQSENKISGTSKGRYTTYFIDELDDKQQPLSMVLRHYYRGGMVRHFSKDKFFFSSLNKTRSFSELTLLAQLWEFGLPVPKPLAGRVKKYFPLRYSNDILIEKIDNARDAFFWLLDKPLSDELWRAMGSTIRMFHNHNVFHADLNIHNILIKDQRDIYLIDFDRGEIRTDENDQRWKQANLARLKRSLEKESSLHSDFKYQASDWERLIEGYQQ